jgi:hypothetical protein
MGGIFALTECAVEGFRGESDPYNAGIAGCAAGLVAGVKCMEAVLFIMSLSNCFISLTLSLLLAHSIATMCAACAGVGATMFAYEYAGGNLKGTLANMPEEDKKAWRESFFKKNKQTEEA